MPVKTREEIRDEMKDMIQSLQPSADLSPGTIMSDVFITPHTFQMADLYERSQEVEDSFNIDLATGETLEVLAANVGKERLEAQKAVGRVLAISTNLSASTSIPVGGLVTTSGVTPKVYQAITSVSFNPVYANAYYSNLLPYEDILRENNIPFNNGVGGQFIDIEATSSGVVGNTGPYTINTSKIPGISYIINIEAVRGGQDSESDEHLRERVKLAHQGVGTGTPNGYKSYVLDNYSSVDSIYVAGKGDELLQRNNGYGGAVDVYIKSESTITSYSETIEYHSEKSNILSFQPVNQILSVKNKTKGITYTAFDGTINTDNVLFDLSKDDSVYSRSIRAEDKVVFRNTDLTSAPTTGDLLEVSYERNEIVNVLQDDLMSAEVYAYNDILVKDMRGVYIDVSVDIRPTGDITTADIETRISEFINSKAAGENVEYSDLIGAIVGSSGVDEVKKSTFRIAKRYVDDIANVTEINDTVTIANLEYTVAGTTVVSFI